MAKINSKSPYFINVTATNLTSAQLDLYIYTGTQTTSRGDITYTINSTAYNEKVTFEISELINDYFEMEVDDVLNLENLWVDTQVTKSISGTPATADTIVSNVAYYGYGYYEDGVNPTNATNALISNTNYIYNLSGQTIKLPIDNNYATGLSVYVNGVLDDSDTFTAPTNSGSVITYYIVASNITSIVVSGSQPTQTFYVKTIDECKHTPYKITFVNKFGAYQDIWFFKRSNNVLTTKDEKYKSNILIDGSFDSFKHQNKILTKQGSERLTLNSGFYDEEYNEIFRQLMLSDLVWVTINNEFLPVNIASSSFNFKTQLNDRLINYTIDIEFANDKINNIR